MIGIGFVIERIFGLLCASLNLRRPRCSAPQRCGYWFLGDSLVSTASVIVFGHVEPLAVEFGIAQAGRVLALGACVIAVLQGLRLCAAATVIFRST